jgi:hypothetical protein
MQCLFNVEAATDTQGCLPEKLTFIDHASPLMKADYKPYHGADYKKSGK